ncbi:hypothetical protein A6J80_06510 [Paracoccus yeei]|uniref:Uncharacterized protein n=3 Tax=Paracoccus TaxID=265 RepID=A0A1V0GQE9_9RHOB|nr:hypothetical protein A6J80_06510 [Paracoccus yeei]ATQ54633.1 hypothetical protein PYTT13_01655 [Paracoccus yeei]AWX92699.1 hypothetical protein DPM13_04535 [Paracoccus mutanolyticus]AYF02011.1 hypothetical protein PY32053_02412 [Paracoccus yeei]OWJ97521.1 hypothetical protein CDV54_03760 [Paracoccus yeei]
MAQNLGFPRRKEKGSIAALPEPARTARVDSDKEDAMSHNTEPERAARRHPGPIIGIAVALLAAAAAWFWWMGAEPREEGDVSRIESTQAPAGGAENVREGSPAPGTPATGAPPEPAQPAAN